MVGLVENILPAVKGASRVPAYALVIVLVVVVFAAASQLTPWLAVVVACLSVSLGVFVIWAIDVRQHSLDRREETLRAEEDRSVRTESPAQAADLKVVRDVGAAARGVLERMVDNDCDLYVVYSSTKVTEFIDQLGHTVRPDDSPAYGVTEEKRVTTIPDAFGIAKIHNLLTVAGKRDRLRVLTSWEDDFKQEYWNANLILIGAGNSNRATADALSRFESPYRFASKFSRNLDALVEVESGAQWPTDASRLLEADYGLLAKLKVEWAGTSLVYLVIAGLGPVGTLAGCHFLEQRIEEVHQEFGSSPFAYVLSVDRKGVGYTFPQIERRRELPVMRQR